MSDTSVMVCWRRPRLGVVNGYLLKLTFEETTGGNITRLVRRHNEQLLEGPRLPHQVSAASRYRPAQVRYRGWAPTPKVMRMT